LSAGDIVVLSLAGHRSIIRAARSIARRLRIKMTVLYLVLQWQHQRRRPRESGDDNKIR